MRPSGAAGGRHIGQEPAFSDTLRRDLGTLRAPVPSAAPASGRVGTRPRARPPWCHHCPEPGAWGGIRLWPTAAASGGILRVDRAATTSWDVGKPPRRPAVLAATAPRRLCLARRVFVTRCRATASRPSTGSFVRPAAGRPPAQCVFGVQRERRGGGAALESLCGLRPSF